MLNTHTHTHSLSLYLSHALTVLAHICAEACCSIDRVPKELLGALRALCIPHTTYKACVTGYTQLTQKTDVRQYMCIGLMLFDYFL